MKSEKMIFATALCVVMLLYSASFGDSLSLKNDTDSEKKTVINLPPPPHFERNPNDVVLGTNKMMEQENVKAVEKLKTGVRKGENVDKRGKKYNKKTANEKNKPERLGKVITKPMGRMPTNGKKIVPVKRKWY
jgi:hypothetical protein